MLGEFVVVTQTAGVQHLVIVHHHGVVKPAAQRQAVDAQLLDILGEAKGARAGNVAAVVVQRQVELGTLAGGVDGRVRKVDFKAQLVAVVGLDARPFQLVAAALAHLDGFGDADKTLGHALQHDAGALQQEHEGGRRTVQNRHLLGCDVHIQIVQTQAGAGRHQVFNGLHPCPTDRNRRCHAGVGNRQRVDRNIHRLGQINAAEHDAGIRLRRPQHQLNTLATVQANPDGTGQGL